MKVLTLNTDSYAGGATKACFRLHISFVEGNEVDSNLLMLEQPPRDVPKGHSFMQFYNKWYQEKHVKQPLIRKAVYKIRYQAGLNEEAVLEKRLRDESKILSQVKLGYEKPSFAISRYRIQDHPLVKSADLIHMHCMINRFLDYASFFKGVNKPVVWTLHDMNPFTGGCTYAIDCEQFKTDCAFCPQLINTEDPAYTKDQLQIKIKGLEDFKDLTVVSPSRWLSKQSMQSTLFKNYPHHLIPYGIDSNNFQPRDRSYSRKLLGIPDDKPVILFVAHGIHNKRKGYQYLKEALQRLDLNNKVSLCAVGAKTGKSDTAPTGFYELGTFTDERMMSIAYSAADVFVIPSLEDNLPNTVLESLMCGTPVIGFPTGGIPDMITDGKNGFLCREVSVDALVVKLRQFLDNPQTLDKREDIRRNAKERWDSKVQAERYINLYKQILNKV